MTMKHYLFLLSVLSVVYLSKAGPLRLQKRAAFYIANETACVVDNIVYSSGDPIPTDDPCEACKCRPPGFACVLKECKVKPGCRAVRHVGHCCPEYVCDNPEITPVIGDNALPPANLLPELYEAGLPGDFSADEVAEPTEQSQTSTQTPEPLESSDIPIVEEPVSDPKIEETSPEIVDGIKDIPGEKEEPKEHIIEKKDEEPQVLFNSETELKKEDDTEVTTVKELLEDKTEVTEVIDILEDKAEVKEDKAEVTEVEKVIEDKSTESTDSKSEVSDESVPELREEEQILTTEVDKVVESEAEESTERHVKTTVTSTTAPTEEISVKNSAAQNSKSLKLLEDQTSEELIEKIELIKEAESSQKTGDESEAVSSVSTEKLSSKTETDGTTVPTKIEPEGEENIAEESSNDHPSIALYSNDDKVIKKESAETVTIVVHVREKSKPPTEIDFETEEKVTEVYLTSEQQEGISVKSNDNITAEISTNPPKADQATSTHKNFEVFPSSTEINNVELSTSSSKDPEEKIEARSEPDSAGLDTEAIPTNEEHSDSKSKIDPPVTETTLTVNEEVSEISHEARESEIIEEIKDKEDEVSEDPKVTEKPEDSKVTEISKKQETTEKPQYEIKITELVEQPNIGLKITIIRDNSEEETEAKSDIVAAEETKPDVEEPKLEDNVESKSEDSLEEAKQENTEEKKEEPKVDKLEEVKTEEKKEVSKVDKLEEVKTDGTTDTESEVRSIEDEPEELKSEEIGETKLEENVEAYKIEEKIEKSTPGETVEESKSKEKTEEAKEEEKIEEAKEEEKITDTNVENKNSEKKQETHESEEVKDQESVESNQPEEPKNSE